jgi:hypothetical protein
LITVVSVPLIMTILAWGGWKSVYLIVGSMPLFMCILVWRWLKLPSGAPVPAKSPIEAASLGPGVNLSAALGEWRFWVIGISFFATGVSVTGCIVNLPTLLAEAGLVRSEILWVAPALGAFAIGGRLIGGVLLDHVWAPAIATVFLSLVAIGLILMARHDLTAIGAATALSLVGFAYGVELGLLPYISSRYFGVLNYAAIYGALFMFAGFGGGLAPVIFSIAHDLTGNFIVVLYSASGLTFLSGLVLLSVGRYRYFTSNRSSTPECAGKESNVRPSPPLAKLTEVS